MARSRAALYSCCALLLLCVVALIVCCALLWRDTCPDGTFSRAVVAADSGRCSRIGRSMLQQGGSAVDGAIATLLCTSVVNPQSMGLGGGSIFTVMDSSGKVKVINSREKAPAKLRPGLLDTCPKTFQLISGSQWIGVPGELRGYEQAHRLYGKLPWAALFQPTIRLAREGLPIPEILGRYLPYINRSQTEPLRKLFVDDSGNLKTVGDVVKFEALADTLEQIAKHGADIFYTGRIAEDLIRDVQDAGGSLTVQDLASYRATVTDAWVVPFEDFQMFIPPPPAGGIVLSFVLNVMKGYNLTSASLDGEQKVLTYHRLLEAYKFANGLRSQIRDPGFSSEELPKRFTERSFADYVRTLISSSETHDFQFYNITPHVDVMGTTHVSVLAEDGSAVSVTSSINHIFGSKVFSTSTGVVLNNQLSDFCGVNQHIFPGEQPPSFMTPAVLKSPTTTLVIGASGGSMILSGLTSALMNHFWFGRSLREAIAVPVAVIDSHNLVKFEPGFEKEVMEALLAIGHQPGTTKRFYNVVNAAKKEDGCICAISDARKMGEPAGY